MKIYWVIVACQAMVDLKNVVYMDGDYVVNDVEAVKTVVLHINFRLSC